MATFSKGQSVTDSVKAAYRYRVETCHRDGTYTVQALFAVDAQGKDVPGFLGYPYRVSGNTLAPIREPLEPGALDADVIHRLRSVCGTLETANGQALAIDFHQLASDVRALLAVLVSA